MKINRDKYLTVVNFCNERIMQNLFEMFVYVENNCLTTNKDTRKHRET